MTNTGIYSHAQLHDEKVKMSDTDFLQFLKSIWLPQPCIVHIVISFLQLATADAKEHVVIYM